MSFYSSDKLKAKSITIVIFFALAGCLAAYYFFISGYRHPEQGLAIQHSKDSSHYQIKGVLIDTTSAVHTKSVLIDRKKLLFHYNPDLLVLSILTLIMMTIASGSFPAFIWQVLKLKKLFNLKRNQILFAVLVASLLLLFLFIIQYFLPGRYSPGEIIGSFNILFKEGYEELLTCMLIAAMLLQIPVLTVIILIGPSSDSISSINNFKKENMVKAAFQFRFLNRVLRNAFWVLSIGIVFSVLTSDALGASIKTNLEIIGFDIHPQKMSFVLGLFFSLFIGAIYIPVYLYFKNRNNQFKEELLDNQHLMTEEGENIAQRIVSGIDTRHSFLENLEMVGTILAPVISSFFS